jgi:hypothetical protein
LHSTKIGVWCAISQAPSIDHTVSTDVNLTVVSEFVNQADWWGSNCQLLPVSLGQMSLLR